MSPFIDIQHWFVIGHTSLKTIGWTIAPGTNHLMRPLCGWCVSLFSFFDHINLVYKLCMKDCTVHFYRIPCRSYPMSKAGGPTTCIACPSTWNICPASFSDPRTAAPMLVIVSSVSNVSFMVMVISKCPPSLWILQIWS